MQRPIFVKQIKEFLKSLLVFQRNTAKTNPALGITQRSVFLEHQKNAQQGYFPKLSSTGYKVFSQFEEDGLLVFLFALLGEGTKTFVEIGAHDGINSNCANLAVHFGWSGCFIEGDKNVIKRGKKFYSKIPTPFHPKPSFVNAFVTRDNINQLIQSADIKGEIELLSIDIDGNDYWIWDAITCIQPKVVIMETHTEFGFEELVVPYKEDYVYKGSGTAHHGASASAMNALASKKGYRLIGATDLGINQIYLRADLLNDKIPSVSPESTLWHPSTQKTFQLIQK